MASKDWTALTQAIQQSLKDQLSAMVEGTIEDLDGPIRDASFRLVSAIRLGSAGDKLVAEISDELALRLLEKKIELKQGFGSLDAVLAMGMNFLFDAAVAGISSVKRG